MKIPGHKLTVETRRVTKHSSSMNMDYEDLDTYLVCTCGYEIKFYALVGESAAEQRMLSLEHCVAVLAERVLPDNVDHTSTTKD